MGKDSTRRAEKVFLFGVLPLVLLGTGFGIYALFSGGEDGRVSFWESFARMEPPSSAPTTGSEPSTPAGDVAAEQRLKTLEQEATAALNAGNMAEAVEKFRAIVDDGNPTATQLSNLGVALISARQTEEGFALLDQAVAADPDGFFSLLNRANARRRAGDLAGAIADQELAMARMPSSPLQKNRLLLMKLEAGRVDEVRQAVDSSKAFGLAELERETAMAAVALAIHDGDQTRAQALMFRAQNILRKGTVSRLAKDRVFDRSRGRVLPTMPEGETEDDALSETVRD
jgi:tetratricopeptide (TPR) repeat protein